MNRKVVSSIFVLIIITLIIILVGFVGYDRGETGINEQSFINMANNANCADLKNSLYVIDHKMVFWAREGNCPDAGYSYVLYGNTTDTVLCRSHDSIAGPYRSCDDPSASNTFDTIMENLDRSDLGLGIEHNVRKIK